MSAIICLDPRTIYLTAKIVSLRRLLAAVSFGGRAGAAGAAADVLGGVNEVSTSYGPPPITCYAARSVRTFYSPESIFSLSSLCSRISKNRRRHGAQSQSSPAITPTRTSKRIFHRCNIRVLTLQKRAALKISH